MKLGYIQSSKSPISSQNVDQIEYKENWSEFIDFLSRIKAGDSVIINSLFDFCCSAKDLFRFYNLSKEFGVTICSSSADEQWFDTSNSELEVTILERFCFECIARSTKRGIEEARRKGRVIGRKVGSNTIDVESLKNAYSDYYHQRATIKESCHRYNISQSSLYRYMRKNSLPNKVNG